MPGIWLRWPLTRMIGREGTFRWRSLPPRSTACARSAPRSGGSGRGEREAAEWVAEQLTDTGLKPAVLESAPGRANTVVRIPGADPAAPALLVHGHLDVVPAEPAAWSVPPFAGEVRDGAVWGRGALDMKDMDAMMLAFARHLARTGRRPPRDIVMAFVADEEDTGEYGAAFLVERDQGVVAHRVLQVTRETRQLRGVRHVLAEQASAADAVGADEIGSLGIEFGAEQPDHDQPAGQLAQIVRRHQWVFVTLFR